MSQEKKTICFWVGWIEKKFFVFAFQLPYFALQIKNLKQNFCTDEWAKHNNIECFAFEHAMLINGKYVFFCIKYR